MADRLTAIVVIGIVKTAKFIGQKGHKPVIESYSINTSKVEFYALLIN